LPCIAAAQFFERFLNGEYPSHLKTKQTWEEYYC
jgi:hypothetical protein